MPAYVIATVDVTDWQRYREYMKVTPGIIAQYGGRFAARAGRSRVLEGEDDGRRVVILEFPTYEAAERFYESPEYARAKKLRAGAATGRLVLVAGAEK